MPASVCHGELFISSPWEETEPSAQRSGSSRPADASTCCLLQHSPRGRASALGQGCSTSVLGARWAWRCSWGIARTKSGYILQLVLAKEKSLWKRSTRMWGVKNMEQSPGNSSCAPWGSMFYRAHGKYLQVGSVWAPMPTWSSGSNRCQPLLVSIDKSPESGPNQLKRTPGQHCSGLMQPKELTSCSSQQILLGLSLPYCWKLGVGGALAKAGWRGLGRRSPSLSPSLPGFSGIRDRDQRDFSYLGARHQEIIHWPGR